MTTNTPQHAMFFPAWFRMLIVAAAVVTLCACQSTSSLAPHTSAGGHTQLGQSSADQPANFARPYPVEPAQYASQEWVDNVPTKPYHGQVPPCSCHGCQSNCPAESVPAANEVGMANEAPVETETPVATETPQANSSITPVSYNPMMDCGPAMNCGPMPGCDPIAGCGPMAGCNQMPNCGCQSCAIVGPSDEYLCDGGDFQMPAGVGYDWRLHGVEQEDTITHYDTVDGRVVVKPSNRVCIYAPRFGAVRRVEGLTVNHHRVGPGGIIDEMSLVAANRTDRVTTTLEQKAPLASLGDQPANLFRSRLQAGGVRSRIAAGDLETFLAPQLNLQVVKLGIIDNGEKPRLAKAIVSAYTWASDVSAQVTLDGKQVQQQIGRTQAGEIFGLEEPDSPQIRLIKLASTGAAQLGEEVEFALRFDNVGDQPIGNVTIIDNLATRLEYVKDSAKSTVDADFTTEANEGGSLLLRWEIDEPLNPGQGGVLRFKARVR